KEVARMGDQRSGSRCQRRPRPPAAPHRRRSFGPYLEVLEARCLLSDLPAPPSSSQLFVSQLYADLLLRPPDAQGLHDFSTLLDRGGADHPQVALAVAASPERHALEVRQVYRALLGRDAEPAAVAGWSAFRNAGGTGERFRSLVLGSPEYLRHRGGTSQ